MKKNQLLILIFIISLFTGFKKKNNQQEDQLLKIAEEYKHYFPFREKSSVIQDVDDWRWSLVACASGQLKMPMMHFSKANPKVSLHGDKLYQLFIKDIHSYIDTSLKIQPIGQVLLKETWKVKQVDSASVSKFDFLAKQSRNDGKFYAPESISELFILYKENKSKSNDEGWVYGIVSLEKSENKPVVIESGKINSCIGCHSRTKYDRIFGVN